MQEISFDEKLLIESMEKLKNGEEFDETSLRKSFEDILERRQAVLTKIDLKMKIVQSAYDYIDSKVTNFGRVIV